MDRLVFDVVVELALDLDDPLLEGGVFFLKPVDRLLDSVYGGLDVADVGYEDSLVLTLGLVLGLVASFEGKVGEQDGRYRPGHRDDGQHDFRRAHEPFPPAMYSPKESKIDWKTESTLSSMLL